MKNLLKELTFKDGLIPAVIADAEGGEVLTLCYMDEDALRETLRTGLVHVFRRSKGRIMKKGETSGHTQCVEEVRVDCLGRSLLLKVRQHVGACHQGYRTCYYRRYDPGTGTVKVVGQKVFNPKKVYGEDPT
jgi:phosphoribosyl-AMP cyclohydrolase